MIQPQSYLAVADNTGAKKIMCIHILGSNRRYAYLGDILIGVVKVSSFKFLERNVILTLTFFN